MAQAGGWAEAEVIAASESLRLLMLRTEDDVLLFPSLQLHDGKAMEGLTDVLRVLQSGVDDPRTWAQWLNVSLPDESPPRNIEYLYDGRLDEVIRDAQHVAWVWSS